MDSEGAGVDRSYRLERLPDAPVGTKVVLHLKPNYADLASKGVIVDAVRRLWRQPDIPVSVNGQLMTQPWGIVASDPDPRENADRSEVSLADQGVLRLDVAGSWAVSDFASLLNQLESAYMRLSFRLLASEPEIWQAATRPFVGTLLPNDRSGGEFAHVMRMIRARVHELRLHRIHIASPGFVELIGSLNPIKIMADFITDWRKENTQRQKNLLEHRRALADRAAEIVKIAPSHAFADRFLRYALDEPNVQLTEIARDVRLEQVSWLQIGEASGDVERPRNPSAATD